MIGNARLQLWAWSRARFSILIGEAAPAHDALVQTLPMSVVLNLLLAFPVFALVRRLLAPAGPRPEVEFVG